MNNLFSYEMDVDVIMWRSKIILMLDNDLYLNIVDTVT